MRKLKILKSLIDFIFIITSCIIPFFIIGIPLLFFISDIGNFKVIGLDFTQGVSLWSKVFIALFMLAYILIYYAIKKFRDVLQDFVRARVFTEKVIANFAVSSKVLFVAGILMFIAGIGFNIVEKSKINLEFGITTNYLCICFGLFFLVLSEIFKASKELKQENDLTI